MHAELSANFRQQLSRNMSNPVVNFLRYGAVDEWFEELYEDHYGYYGHGTHVAGIIAAASSLSQTTSPTNSEGVAGGCFNCALLITKIGYDLFNEIIYTTDIGAQVINRSGPQRFPQPTGCVTQQAVCDALARARNRGVVFVAASGNNDTVIDFPANATAGDGTPLAIAVGGAQPDGFFWSPGYGLELGSNHGPQQALIAPAKDVISTTYRNQMWSSDARCGDQLNSSTNLKSLLPNYGDCNGTSMAAPHVSALAGLVKSADPLLNTDEVRTVLISSANNWPARYDDTGYGFPDAGKAVQKALDGYGATDPVQPANKVTNRLTPLFSLFSAKALDHFYTTVPQMAAAALDGTLKPQPSAQVAGLSGGPPSSSWAACCTEQLGNSACLNYHTNCSGMPVLLPSTGLAIFEPDGATRIGGMPVALISNPTSTDPDVLLGTSTEPLLTVPANTSPFYGAVTSSTSPGNLGQLTATNLQFKLGETQTTIYAYPLDFLALTYNVLDKDLAPAIARKVPEYTAYPAYRYCKNASGGLDQCPNNVYTVQPTASVRVFTSYTNPLPGLGAQELVPLYRLSFVCRDGHPYGTHVACGTNPYHISHVYSTDPTEVFSGTLFNLGYRLDGIEGYVFSKAYTPPNGTVKLCRKYSAARDDYVLFPSSGGSCSASSFEAGTYDQSVSGTDYVGYVYSVTSDGTVDGRAHANIQIGLFRNTTNPPVSQFILDFDLNGGADSAVNFGLPGDKGLVADMNNDGRGDFVVFRAGAWYVDVDRNGTVDSTYYLGGDPSDKPLIGKLHSASASNPDLAGRYTAMASGTSLTVELAR